MKRWTRTMTPGLMVVLGAIAGCSGKGDGTDSEAPEGTTDDGGSGSDGSDSDDSGSDDSGGGAGDDDDGPELQPTGCDLTETSYVLDFSDATVLEPSALESFILPELDGDMGLALTAQGASTLEGYVSQLDEGVQNLCEPTSPLPTGSWNDPRLMFGPVDLPVVISDDPVELSAFSLTGTTRADCSGMDDVDFNAQLDMRIVGPFMGALLGSTDPDELCESMAIFGAECTACDADAAVYCVQFQIEGIRGERVEEMMVPVDPAALPDDC